MTLLVRDEIDIIKQNIDFHLENQIDGIIVTDNGSIDGTRDILQDYLNARKILKIIDEPQHNYNQQLWVNRMAEIATCEFQAEILIHADADEFWKPRTEYKTIFNGQFRVKQIRANNIVLSDNPWPHNIEYVSIKPCNGSLLENPMLNFVWKKVVLDVRHGMISVSQGNHRASLPSEYTEEVSVIHLPVRDKQSFFRKVINGGSAYENSDFPESTGVHWREWYKLYQLGKLEKLYDAMLMDENKAQYLLEENFIVKIEDFIEGFSVFGLRK